MNVSESLSTGKEGNHSIETRCSLLIAHCSLLDEGCVVMLPAYIIRRGQTENAVDNDNVLRVESWLRCHRIRCCNDVF
jgi:hypothetical protein